MSVKELVLKDGFTRLLVSDHSDKFFFSKIEAFNVGDKFAEVSLDRNQAHLLYLYLKERFEP